MIDLKFVNKSTNEDPAYATDGAAAFDLRANLPDGHVVISSGHRHLISTGLFFEIPEGYELQIRPRSGLAAKHGISIVNTPGTIDSDYRGDVGVILINHGADFFVVNHGDRIAQAVFAPAMGKKQVKLMRTEEIDSTERGSGGFGSTGIK